MSAANLKVTRSTVSSPKSSGQFDMSMLLGVVFLVMALLQLVSFNSFKDWFSAVGYHHNTLWAVVVIIAEVVAALGFIRVALPPMASRLSRWCAILASGFWFIQTVKLVSDTAGTQVSNSGFFGKYLMQTPSWWTVLEATILLLWTLWALGLAKESQ